MNKKAVTQGIIVTVIMMAIVLVVSLNFYNTMFHMMRGLFEDYFFCLMKKVMSAYSEIPGLGITVWGASCNSMYHFLTFGSSDKANAVDLTDPFTQKELKNIAKWYDLSLDSLKDENERLGANKAIEMMQNNGEKPTFLLQYRFEEAIAAAMKRCWGRNGEGDLPLGPKWRTEDGLKNLWDTKPVVYCDPCAIIQFEDEVARRFATRIKPASMNTFLKNNPSTKTSSISYWEYIKDESLQSDLFGNYPYTIREKGVGLDNNDLAVVYVRGNVHQLAKLYSKLPAVIGASDEPVAYDLIRLIPLDMLETECPETEVKES